MAKFYPIVGVWFVKAFDAPFIYHMFTFHADGTMSQANPDAGDPETSDSDGMGLWEVQSKQVKGKFVEITADRKTHKFISRGEIAFTIVVAGDSFTGTADLMFYDEGGKLQRGPLVTSLGGTRIVLRE